MAKLSFQYVRGPQGAETLVDFLARRFRYHDAAEWTTLVRDGHVTVDGTVTSPQHALRSGHRILYHPPPKPEPEVDARFAVLFEDEYLIALEKSGNLPTSPSGKYWENCLVHVAQKELRLPRLYAVHRLDRETSGVNLLAKTAEAAGKLGDTFSQGRVDKEYVAVLRGSLATRSVYVSAPLGDDPAGEIRIRQTARRDGRAAVTRFTLLAHLPGASLVRIEPATGRTHQIRVHALLIGHPVWGDKLYGRSDAEFLASVKAPRQKDESRHLLHATRLRFNHPVTAQPIELRSSPKVLLERFYEELGDAGDGSAPIRK